MVDEAHERSVSSDVLLGLLRKVCIYVSFIMTEEADSGIFCNGLPYSSLRTDSQSICLLLEA